MKTWQFIVIVALILACLAANVWSIRLGRKKERYWLEGDDSPALEPAPAPQMPVANGTV